MSASRSGILNGLVFAIVCSEFPKYIKPLSIYSELPLNASMVTSLTLERSFKNETIKQSVKPELDLAGINEAIIDVLDHKEFPVYLDVVLGLSNSTLLQSLESKKTELNLSEHAEKLLKESIEASKLLLQDPQYQKYYRLRESMLSAYFIPPDYNIGYKIICEYIIPNVLIHSAHAFLKEYGTMFAKFSPEFAVIIEKSLQNFASHPLPKILPNRYDRLAVQLTLYEDDLLDAEQYQMQIEKEKERDKKFKAYMKSVREKKAIAVQNSLSVKPPIQGDHSSSTQSTHQVPAKNHGQPIARPNTPENTPPHPKIQASVERAVPNPNIQANRQRTVPNPNIQANTQRAVPNPNIPDADLTCMNRSSGVAERKVTSNKNQAAIKPLNQYIISPDYFRQATLPMMPKPVMVKERKYMPPAKADSIINAKRIAKVTLNTLTTIGTGFYNQMNQILGSTAQSNTAQDGAAQDSAAQPTISKY